MAKKKAQTKQPVVDSDPVAKIAATAVDELARKAHEEVSIGLSAIESSSAEAELAMHPKFAKFKPVGGLKHGNE